MLEKLEVFIKGTSRNRMIFVIAVLIAVCYVNSLGVFFLWDDYALILDNPLVKQFDMKSFLKPMHFQETGSLSSLPVYFRPLQTITYMLDYSVWRTNAFGYHLTNIFLHFVNSVLLLILLSIFSKNKIIPFLGAVLFAVNPSFTLSVTYISGRSDLLVLLFALLSMICFLKSFEKEKLLPVFYVISLVSFALMLFSKEIGLFILPAYFFLNSNRSKEHSFKGALVYLPYFIIAVFYLIFRPHFVFKGWEFTGLESKNTLFYLLTFVKGNIVYLFKAVFPREVYMQYTIQTVNSFNQIWFYISILFVFISSSLILLKKSLDKNFLLGYMWFFLPLSALILMNIVFAMKETELLLPLHNLYFSFPGIILMGDFAFSKFKTDIRKIFVFCATVAVIYYSASTIYENNFWHEEIPFYERIIAKNNNSAFNYIPLSNLGYSYEREKEYDLAEKSFLEAARLSGRNALFYNGLAFYYIRRGDYKKAIKTLEESLFIDSNFSRTYFLMGFSEMSLNNFAKAKANFKKALDLNPDSKGARFYLGSLK